MADKFVQIRDGAGNNIYPNLNLSPFHSQFFTTSTVGGRARITLAESAYMVASAVVPSDSGKNQYSLAGRVAVTNPSDNILSNLTSRLVHGQALPENYLWLSANTWIVPSLREIASAFAYNVPVSCTSAKITSLVTSEAISSALRAIPTVSNGRVLKATATGLEWSNDLTGITTLPSVYDSANHATDADTLGGQAANQLSVSSAAVAGNAAKLGGKTANQLLVSSAVSADNATKLSGTAASTIKKAFSSVTQTGTSMIFKALDNTLTSHEVTSAVYATSAGKANAITLTSAQYATSAFRATSAQITSLVTAQAISSALRSNITGVGTNKVLQATATGLQWATVAGGGGDDTINVLKGLTSFNMGGYVLKTTGSSMYWGVDSVGQGGDGSTATVSLAQYAGSGSTCTTSDAGRVGTLCYQNLAELYNMCVNGSADYMTYTGWDNSYTVPSAGAIAQLLAGVVQNILRNGSGWNGSVAITATTT